MHIHLSPTRKKRFFSIPAGLVAGVVTAQVVGTLHVGWSNRLLYNRITAVFEAGYLAVPNHLVEPGLLSFKAAVGGGVFFSLTIGVLLSLLTIGWLQLTMDLLGLPKVWIGLVTGIFGGAVFLNLDGINLFATAYLLLVPLAVSLCRSKVMTENGRKDRLWHSFWFFVPPVILILTWFPFFGPHVFSDFRDHVLWSHSTGRIVSDFYYRYTLYPAEAFKSLAQKQIRTVCFEPGDASLKPVFLDAFVAQDYFPVGAKENADVIIRATDAGPVVLQAKARRMQIERAALRERPDQILDRLSRISDNNRRFRKLVYFSLLIGSPLFLYVIMSGLFRRSLGLFLPRRPAIIGASLFCLGLGLAVLMVMKTDEREKTWSSQALSDMAGSTDRRRWMAVLKIMDQKGIDPSLYAVYPAVLERGNLAERYWLARALGNSRTEETYRQLIRMLDDPSPNVVCMAMKSLGKRNDRRAIPVIFNRLNHTDHWYVQWYAYRTLKKLKWRQSKFN